MTSEEGRIEVTIAIFEQVIKDRNPSYLVPVDCETALEALREKAAREKGCEYCCDVCDDIPYPECSDRFCRKCGRELPANKLWGNNKPKEAR